MNQTSSRNALALGALLLAAAVPVQAQNWLAKVGVLRYDTHSQTNGIQGIGVPPGADAVVGDATTAVFTIERLFTDKVGLELVLGVPPRIKARGAGTTAFLGDDVLSAKNYAPTFLVNYHFGEPGAALRPYVGLGMNYTQFKSTRSKLAPQVSLSDSWGLAAHAGIDWSFSKNMGLWASIGRADVKSDLVAVGSVVLTSQIDFKPWTYSAGLRVSF